MDDDGFTVHSRRRRGTIRDRDDDAPLSRTPRYAGSDEYFEKAHARRYGREEGLGPDGKHHHGSGRFPRGSEREQMHTQYSKSTRPRDMSRKAYEESLKAVEREFRSMDVEEQQYYRQHTDGFTPHQHERLEPPARHFRDNSLRNAQKREAFLDSHPYGYHTAQEQRKHYDYADGARKEYNYADKQQKSHAKFRSFANIDPRRDQFDRPVSYR